MSIKIAIVDDTQEEMDQIVSFCRKYSEINNVTFTISTFKDGLDFIADKNLDYDVIMLDIMMPYLNGMQIARKIRETNENVCIVFITCMVQYALQGYEVSATDFIVKPVKYDLFAFKLDKILSVVERKREKVIDIKTKSSLRRVKLSDICYIETRLHKVIYHCVNEDIESWGSMKKVLEQIDSASFALCHNSYYVNLDYVEEIKGSTVTVNGVELMISRAKRKSFLDALSQDSRCIQGFAKAK